MFKLNSLCWLGYSNRGCNVLKHYKWFEPRSISSSYSMIVRVSVVRRRTVVGDWRFDNLSGFCLYCVEVLVDNWVRNSSSRPLDKTETHVLSYGLKHSVTPKRIPTESIVSSAEAVLSRQRDLSESAKDNIRSRIASTVQSASIPANNLTKDEQQALKRLSEKRR